MCNITYVKLIKCCVRKKNVNMILVSANMVSFDFGHCKKKYIDDWNFLKLFVGWNFRLEFFKIICRLEF
jgi:hypothetical protein